MWERILEEAPAVRNWPARGAGELAVARLPRPAWPIVAGAASRALADAGRSVLILVPAPDRFCDDLRPWLAGRPNAYVFAEVAVSFLDRPPAFDEAVNKRMEALNALADRSAPSVLVSSRRALTGAAQRRHAAEVLTCGHPRWVPSRRNCSSQRRAPMAM